MVTMQKREIKRRLVDVAKQCMADDFVLAIHGPRSVGKSTVLRRLAIDIGARVVDLDNPEDLQAFMNNPMLFVESFDPLFIDEYQKYPASLDAIKAALNTSALPGRFVISGSTRPETLPHAAQALTGRLHVVDLLPLSQGEIAGITENFLEVALGDPLSIVRQGKSATSRADYAERACAGGFPLALERSGARRNKWFDDYIKLSVERDIRSLAPRLRTPSRLTPILERLASQTGQILNVAATASKLGFDNWTVESYIRLMEDIYLIRRLPAWGKTLRSRVGVMPKVHVVDSGLAARLMRVTPSRLALLDNSAMTEFGHLLETFVVGEIAKQASWLEENVALGHWRTRDGLEVDVVVENDDGLVTAFEVKSGSHIGSDDLKPMRNLRSAVGDLFSAGFLFYTGRYPYTVEDRIHVIPIDQLWRPVS